MARFQLLLKKTTHFDRLQPTMGIDLGSANTRVIVAGKVVWQQPTVVAWHVEHQAVIAIGDEAYHLAGKTSSAIQLVYPIREGVVADLKIAVVYIETIFRKLRAQGLLQSLLHPRCLVAVPAGASPVEQQFFTRVVHQAGLTIDQLVTKPAAILRASRQAHDQTLACLDLGAQTVEVGLRAGGEMVAQTTLRGLGAERWVSGLQQLVRNEHACDISWQTAEKALQMIGYVQREPAKEMPVMVVRGREVQTAAVTTVKISADLCMDMLRSQLQSLISELQLFLSTVSSEVVTQALTNGLYVVGGGAQLHGLAEVLGAQLGNQVVIAPSPAQGVIVGLEA